MQRHARGFIVAGAVLYALLVDWVYVHVLAEHYRYLGYHLNERALLFDVGAIAWAVLPALWMPRVLSRPSQVIYWFLYLLVFVPVVLVPRHALVMEAGALWVFNGVLAAAFLGLSVAYRLPLVRITEFRLAPRLFWPVFALGGLVMVGYIVKVFGLQFDLVAFSDVYSVRFQYRDTVAEAGGLIGYAIPWVGNVINPFLMAYGLTRRRFDLLGLGVAGQLLVYSITGFKSIALSTVLLVALLFVIRREGRFFGVSMVGGSVALVAAAAVAGVWGGLLSVTYLAVGRLIITSGLLTGYYLDFFSSHPKALMGHSVFAPLVDYPYDTTPAFLIGARYFQRPEMSANANVWADAFANFGYGGVFFFTIILGVFFWVYDSAAQRHDYRLAALLMGVPAISLSNTALQTSMLTHGLALALLLLLCLPESDQS